MSWQTTKTGSNVVQVIPLDDEQEHDETVYLDEDDPCKPMCECSCGVKIEFSEKGCWIIIHQAFDGRQALEWALDIIGGKD